MWAVMWAGAFVGLFLSKARMRISGESFCGLMASDHCSVVDSGLRIARE
jgi:hypothetical protein